MRRGHNGAGGWRGDNPRHFRPRSGGTPHFRAPMPFGLLESPRFPPPVQRYRGPRGFNQQFTHADESLPDHDRGAIYRGHNNHLRSQERGHHPSDRVIVPSLMNMRQDNSRGPFNKSSYYGENSNYSMNNMGDVDHRHQNSYGPRQISPWVNPPFERRHYGNDHKMIKHHNMGDSMLQVADYTGHRPPASDHYSATSGPNNNNDPYSHSVDDTVDIVRRRLQNRDSQDHQDPIDQRVVDTDMRKNDDESYHKGHQEQRVKKRVQRQWQSCDKMKNKIVQQLFKMDKGKIHKLMDNPKSSSKFEYAINSLITQSQNSFNRHMRSEAEKSLISANSSSDFIHNDNNTIYEDTFMKQMQGVLDPQDTILLEDIKPLVLAELSKVLCLDDFERYEGFNDHGVYPQDEQYNTSYYNEPTNEDYTNKAFYEHDQGTHFDNEYITSDLYEDRKLDFTQEPTIEGPSTLFERRKLKKLDFPKISRSRSTERWQPRKSVDNNATHNKSNDDKHNKNEEPRPLFDNNERSRSRSTESWQPRKSVDNNSAHNKSNEEKLDNTVEPRPLFDNNCDQLSEDDDPFADLDNQYHVAVDHTFIDQEDGEIVSPVGNTICDPTPIQTESAKITRDTPEKKCITKTEVPKAQSENVIKEIDMQLQDMAPHPRHGTKVPLLLSSKVKIEKEIQDTSNSLKIKQEIADNVLAIKETLWNKNNNENVKTEGVNVKSEPHTPTKEPEKNTVKHTSDSRKHTHHSDSRKRSVDQKPSHRKEKRKKSSHSECQEAAKSILNMFYVDNKPSPSPKDNKTSNLTDKSYSDKYVKRKDTHNKSKVSEPKIDPIKHNSNHSHSILSPTDTSSSSVDQTPSMSDKVKLTAIDMFSGIPKKGNSHQSHKNIPTQTSVKSPEEIVIKPVIPSVTSFARKLTKRHISTQVVRKLRNKECQTASVKTLSSGTQTEPVKFESNEYTSANPLERMKEIDMEIQMLLQEKFKLYNSMESNDKSKNSAISLGMAVLNVPMEIEENPVIDVVDLSADSIAEDFTNLPAEELEQIALESMEPIKSPVIQKKGRRQKVMENYRKKSESPTARGRKVKPPNISLLEQIITDDRPIEEIISLDALETTPTRSKKRPSRSAKKKPSKAPRKDQRSVRSKSLIFDQKSYNLKPCYVLLERLDMDAYTESKNISYILECIKSVTVETSTSTLINQNSESLAATSVERLRMSEENSRRDIEEIQDKRQIVEEIVNDIQIDMMDVSEDIVIGDEVKIGDRDVNERVLVTEDIILDNSQSSAECSAPEVNEGECKLYDYSTDDALKRDSLAITGNADSVLAIECLENSFIASCVDGNVYHFSNDGQIISTMRGSSLAVTCLTIVKEACGTSYTVYTGSLDSRIRYYDLDTGMEKGPECNVLSPIQTMDRAWDTVFVGTRTGFVLQFECKNNMLIPVSTIKFSEQSILALRAMREGPRKVLLVAARSDNVTIKDAQTGLLLRTLEGPKMTVYSLLFEDGKVYCGTSGHHIHVFDYASGAHVHAHEGGKGAVCLRATGGLVFAGCYDGTVYVYREGETRPLAQLRGPSLMLLSLAVQGTKIIAGYKDRSLFVWKIPLAVLQEMIL